jgi:hypothetical protein
MSAKCEWQLNAEGDGEAYLYSGKPVNYVLLLLVQYSLASLFAFPWVWELKVVIKCYSCRLCMEDRLNDILKTRNTTHIK